MKQSAFKRVLAATVLTAFGLPHAAHAYFVWLDDKGVKQYSDLPPPPSVPANRILKRSGGPAAATETPAVPDKAEPTTAEKNAEFRKRKSEQAEKEKATEETKLAADKTHHCERTEYNRALNSGERISRMDKNGERTFLTEEQLAKEQRDTQHMLEDCK